MNKVPWSLAGRLLARDWRSGEVLILLASLVVAVAAMSAVAFFTDRVRQAVSAEAGEALAADLRIENVRPLDREYFELAESFGVATAEVIHFRSVVLSDDSSALADVRAVTAGYPLRGEVRIADSLAGRPYRAGSMPAPGEIWAEPSLLARLGLEVGDTMTVGALQLDIARSLEFRPDEGWRLMDVEPSVLINMDDLEATQLLLPGSIAEFQGLFAGEEAALGAFRTELESRLAAGIEVDDIRDARPEVRSSLEQAERFLVLAALVSVLLGGVAVAMSARRFVARRLDAVTLMKCMGARYRDVLRLNLTQLLILVIVAGLVGSAVGFLAQFGLTGLLADFVEAELPPAARSGALLGPMTALIVAIGFALPPLLQLGTVPPIRVLRKDIEPPPIRYVTIYAVAGLSITGLLYLLFGDWELIAYVLGGAVATFLALYLAGRLLVAALQPVRSAVGVSWRYGISNVARRGRESSVQVVAFGIGLMVLILLTLIRTELMVQWRDVFPDAAPNNFIINIQPDQRAAIESMLAERGIESPGFTPLARARISHVNGRPADEYGAENRFARRELNDEINLTWSSELMSDNELTSGEWWAPDTAENLLSLEQSMLWRLGLELGDELTYDIGGQSVTVRVTNTRNVNWQSFNPNFFMVMSPNAGEALPHTYITSFRVGPEQRGIMLELAREFPGISVIDIDAVIEQVRGAVERAALAVQYVFLFTIAAGIMVLLAAIQSTRDERMFESAVLRTLGARRMTVLQGVASEFTVLGMLAGLLASAGAWLIAYFVATELFDLQFGPGLWPWFAGIGAGGLIVGISGTLAVRAVVREPPITVLRGA